MKRHRLSHAVGTFITVIASAVLLNLAFMIIIFELSSQELYQNYISLNCIIPDVSMGIEFYSVPNFAICASTGRDPWGFRSTITRSGKTAGRRGTQPRSKDLGG